MDASAIHRHLGQVKAGRMSRRAFVRLAIGAGLTLPMAGMLMLHAGIASSAERQAYKPTKRGGGGLLKLLLWQGPTTAVAGGSCGT
jgi:peptide/nickel transport system substrate-binding protein